MEYIGGTLSGKIIFLKAAFILNYTVFQELHCGSFQGDRRLDKIYSASLQR